MPTLYQSESLPDINQATLFYEKYEPREELGSGISSVVRRCISRENNNEYAVKIIDLTGGNLEQHSNDYDQIDYTILKRIQNEVNILRKVRGKPNIIHMVESFRTSAYYFIVFELMERGELFDYLTLEVSLSEHRCRNIMKQIFNALKILHNHKIIHRDVKMENVLMSNDLSLKLTDYGLSLELPDNFMDQYNLFHNSSPEDQEKMSSNTCPKLLDEMVGTPCYMAPEMLEASMFEDAAGYSYPVDLWACGVILYTLLTGGKQPFYARKIQHLVRKIMNCDYSLEIPELEFISEEAKSLISGLLNPDPLTRLTAEQALNSEFILQTERRRIKNELVRRISSVSSNSGIEKLSRAESQDSLISENNRILPQNPDLNALESCQNSALLTSLLNDSIELKKKNENPKYSTPKKELDTLDSSIGINVGENNSDYCEDIWSHKQKSNFNPRQKFKQIIWVVRACLRWRNLGHQRISSDSLALIAKTRPYEHQAMRHIIDQTSYSLYRHWLNNETFDNSHALLFENSPKILQDRLQQMG